MKVPLNPQSRRLRRDLGQLLRRLRAIHREILPEVERAARSQREISEAGELGAFIAFRGGRGAGNAVPFVDHERLGIASAKYDTGLAVSDRPERCA